MANKDTKTSPTSPINTEASTETKLLIDDGHIRQDLPKRLVTKVVNGRECTCGRYFYISAKCGHSHRRHGYLHRCGKTTSLITGAWVLCQKPAPDHVVKDVRTRSYCRECLNKKGGTRTVEEAFGASDGLSGDISTAPPAKKVKR